MREVVFFFAVIGAISAEAPLGYNYNTLQSQSQVQYHQTNHYDQLNGFKPSHGYPCNNAVIHHNIEGRVVNHHVETSGEPILAPPLPAVVNTEKQITVNSQIAFGENSHAGTLPPTTKQHISLPSPLIVQQLPHYSPPSQAHLQQVVHNSASIIHGVGKAPPPFNVHHHPVAIPIPLQPIPVQQRQILAQPSPPIRPQLQYLAPKPNIVQQSTINQHVIPQSISISTGLIPPPVDSPHGNFLEQSQVSGSFGSVNFAANTIDPPQPIGNGLEGHLSSSVSTSSSSSPSILVNHHQSTGNALGSASFNSGFGSSGANTLGFTSIGSTHNFNHPDLDQGLSQVISETFANAGVGENVEKHIYVHIPPADIETQSYQPLNIPRPLPSAPKKHYKIIFIKAPNQEPSTNIYTHIAQQQQSEEKTLVYVLVKKPDEPTIQDIQHIQNTYKPSKPEVYFIKYKAHKDNEGSTNAGNGGDFAEGIDVRGGINGESNSIQENVIQPRNPIVSAPSQIYGPPVASHQQHK